MTATPRGERFRDDLIRPVLAVVTIGGTVIQWPAAEIVYPPLALTLFVLVSLATVGSVFPWTRLTQRQQIAAATAYMLLGALLLPLAHATTTAALIPYFAAAGAGFKLSSRRAAVAVAVAGSITAAAAIWLVGELHPDASQWAWWIGLSVGLPVYIGIANKYRLDAVSSARQAAAQAQRAAESEAREAALEERGRIAREIHDVLGHSLTGIALQLDLADALREQGRDAEATQAIHKARALAVDSISETRTAVHALREDTLPLPDTLRAMAKDNDVGFELTGTAEPAGADTTHTLVRAAQEALTNAAKHAPGATRNMRLDFGHDRITLTVTNGPATSGEPAVSGGTGMGLVGMRERVALLGGTLRAGPDGQGWTVELELPR